MILPIVPSMNINQTIDNGTVPGSSVYLNQWRLVALKVPEARTQCLTIIVFTTPVGFSERDTHLLL